MAAPFRITVLISGGGTTLKNLIDARSASRLDAEICHVISSSPTAKGLGYADDAQIPSSVVCRRDFENLSQFSSAIFEKCRSTNTQLVVMGGFLKRVKIPADFVNRVINIHPSLIPAFCGKGMYGKKVHQAAIEYGVKLSGCTVHFVDDQYDHGPIIAQRTVPLHSDDSAEVLAARVFEQECKVYPEIINAIASGRVKVSGREVIVS